MKGKILQLSVLFIFTIATRSTSQTITDILQITGTGIETGKSIITDLEGSVIIWGTFVETLDLDPTAGVYNLTATSTINDGYVAKYTSSGTLLWAKDFGGANSYTAINAVDVDQNNNVYITGAFTGTIDVNPSPATVNITSNGDVDLFITKLDVSGNYLWAKHIGGIGTDQADDIKTNDLTHFYISGIFSGTVDFDPSAGIKNLTTTNPNTPSEENRSFIAKYDLEGNIVWAENIGGRGGKMFVNKNSASNDYILFYGGGTAFNTTLEDFDPSGNTVSPVPPPLPGANYAVVAKYDPSGNYIWSVFFRTFTGMNVSAGPGIGNVLQDAAKNIYVGGSYVSSFAAYPENIISLTPIGSVYSDAMLIKLDSAGGLIWQKKIGAPNAFDYIGDMAFDASGMLHIAGSFGGFGTNSMADFNIPDSPETLTSNGNYDGFVAGYSPEGNFLYAGGTGGTGSDYMAGIASFNNRLWSFGGFENQADCDPFAGVTTLTSDGATDLFIDSYTFGELTCGIPASEFTSNITSQSAKVNWSAETEANKYKVRYRESNGGIWTTVSAPDTHKKLKNLTPSTKYDWEVKSVCSAAGLGTSAWSALQNFTTKPLRLAGDLFTLTDFEIFPNPVSSTATLSFHLANPSHVVIELFSMDGKNERTIADESMVEGNQQVNFNRHSLTAGIYLLRLRTDEQVITRKVIIQ